MAAVGDTGAFWTRMKDSKPSRLSCCLYNIYPIPNSKAIQIPGASGCGHFCVVPSGKKGVDVFLLPLEGVRCFGLWGRAAGRARRVAALVNCRRMHFVSIGSQTMLWSGLQEEEESGVVLD